MLGVSAASLRSRRHRSPTPERHRQCATVPEGDDEDAEEMHYMPHFQRGSTQFIR